MPIIDTDAASARYHALLGIIEDLDARLSDRYDPALDELEREAAELRWQIRQA